MPASGCRVIAKRTTLGDRQREVGITFSSLVGYGIYLASQSFSSLTGEMWDGILVSTFRCIRVSIAVTKRLR